jgi:hypothetical protein
MKIRPPIITLLASLLLAPLAELYAGESDKPIVGAIRWDGWSGEGNVVKQMERSLGQPKYHFRLPWFAQVLGGDKVRINGDSQEIVEKEIEYAAEAGLDYWAFVDYWDQSHDLSITLERYRAAKDKRDVRYCFVEEGSRMDAIGTNGFARLVGHFKDPHYQTVLEGRPLLFVFVKTSKLGKAEWAALKRQTIAAGMKAPYLVLMGWNPAQDEKDRVALGFDAVSAYARGGSYSMTQPSYAEQCALIRRDRWGKWRDLRIPSVTFVSAGWDTRPRNERPPSWMHGVPATPDPTPPEQQKPLIDAVTATPDELATHLREALEWTKLNRDINPSRAIIIYAWNEHDEGGWLSPTWTPEGKPNTARLDAIRSVLKPLRAVSNDVWRVTNSVLAVAVSTRDAGAVSSLIYKGKELVNDFDHGRQLQVAWSYNDADEAYNPTEAGSDQDGKGKHSTSQLISVHVESNTLRTVSHPAYWRHTSLPEQYRKNTALTTKDMLAKQITLGYQGDPHVMVFDTQVALSRELTGPQVSSLRIEAPTLYASHDLNTHYLMDPADGKLTRVALRSQTKNLMNTVINQITRRDHVPIISTPDEQYAVAFYSSEQVNFWSYYTWDVPSDDPSFACSKIAAFYKHPAEAGQSYMYRTFIIVGDLATVKTSVQKLCVQYHAQLK